MGYALSGSLPAWGRGRVDTFNPYKAIQFNWALDQLPHDELIGASDFPSLWNQQPREGMHLHWDGNNTSVDERNLSASLGAGVTPVTVDHASLQRIHDWIWTLPPPRYPFAIDQARSLRGKAIFDTAMRGMPQFRRQQNGNGGTPCFGEYGPLSPEFVHLYFFRQSGESVSGEPVPVYAFQQDGRICESAAGWGLGARAVSAQRLRADIAGFARGSGQSSEAIRARLRCLRSSRKWDSCMTRRARARLDLLYDTTIPGNGNGGHLWGTTLPADQKRDLIEFMKTL